MTRRRRRRQRRWRWTDLHIKALLAVWEIKGPGEEWANSAIEQSRKIYSTNAFRFFGVWMCGCVWACGWMYREPGNCLKGWKFSLNSSSAVISSRALFKSCRFWGERERTERLLLQSFMIHGRCEGYFRFKSYQCYISTLYWFFFPKFITIQRLSPSLLTLTTINTNLYVSYKKHEKNHLGKL